MTTQRSINMRDHISHWWNKNIVCMTVVTMICVFAAGCSHTITGSLQLQPGDEAQITVRGSRSEINVTNTGPSDLDLAIINRSGETVREETLVATAALYRVRRSFLRILLYNRTETPLHVQFTARGAEGAMVSMNGEPVDETLLTDTLEVGPDGSMESN